jgi:hypothetical protein
MAGRPEPRLGHADDQNTELGMRMRSQARPALRIQIGIAVHDQQAKAAHVGQHGTQARQLPQEELTGLVGRHLGNQHRPLRKHG